MPFFNVSRGISTLSVWWDAHVGCYMEHVIQMADDAIKKLLISWAYFSLEKIWIGTNYGVSELFSIFAYK